MAETITAPKVAEGAPSKARRYLIEGRLTVKRILPDQIGALCRGDGETYRLGFGLVNDYALGWWCSCPARSQNCAHLRALRLVVDAP